ncbi:MAG: hypothetical protein R6V58_11815 [Planctomycetota bacterium]
MGKRLAKATTRPCRWLLATCTALLLAGCVSPGPKPPTPEETRAAEANVNALIARLRTLVEDESATADARQRYRTLKADLDRYPQPIVIRCLVRALRSEHDAFNSVLLGLLDQREAANWAPAGIRARTLTIEHAITLRRRGIRRAAQAIVFIRRIVDKCAANDPQAPAVAWAGLLQANPIHARAGTRRVDVTHAAQSLAALGLIHVDARSRIRPLFNAIVDDQVTASPLVLSHCLIYLSGRDLKPRLLQWLNGPPLARAAAVHAVDFLRLQPLDPAADPRPARVKQARAWADKLPAALGWSALATRRFHELVSLAGRKDLNDELADKLARARARLRPPTEAGLQTWYRALPPADRRTALRRLLGIDSLAAAFRR